MAQLLKTKTASAFGLRPSAKRLSVDSKKAQLKVFPEARKPKPEGQLRQPQFPMLRNYDLPALALVPIEHAQHLVHLRVRIDSHGAIVNNEI
jgi:hypothetical protein